MHKLLLTALLTTVAIPALAADLPAKAPARPAAPVADWTGFYIGGHAGYGWGRFSDIDEDDLIGIFTGHSFSEPKMKGWVAGIHGGYNWQVSQQIVLGIEGDYSFADINDEQSLSRGPANSFIRVGNAICINACVQTDNLNIKINSLASIRGRFGFLMTPNFLLYGTGGVAFAHTKVNVNSSSVTGIALTGTPIGTPFANLDASEKTNWTGFVVGGGGEWMLTRNILLRVEYLHYDFGDKTLTIDGNATRHAILDIPGTTFPVSTDVKTSLRSDVIRGGLSLKF
jgi:outer membrane immunogenic protein